MGHLAKTGYSAAKSKRLFTGVQGQLEGELFGAKNLFEFKPYERFSEAVLDKERDNLPYQIEEDKNHKEKLDEHYGEGMVRKLLDNTEDKILEVLGKEGGLVDGHFNADVVKESD